jgi:hypothetical protein
MTGTTFSSSDSFYVRPVQSDRDVSWYGTLGLLVACIGLLVAVGLVG